ncbi:MAG: DUF86 domain-containing protein [Lachnospiraceae bacterium]|nr:DUF86 domain-containing protein [Lachnospiraceae bacterium]
MQRRDRIIIQKVISEINIGQEMLGDISLQDFLRDEKLKRAVAMTVINIGELVKNITQETRQRYSYIPWRAIAGMRDMTAHFVQRPLKPAYFLTFSDKKEPSVNLFTEGFLSRATRIRTWK